MTAEREIIGAPAEPRHLREVTLMLPDARSSDVRRRVAAAVDGLSRRNEDDAMLWIESVSEFDEPETGDDRP